MKSIRSDRKIWLKTIHKSDLIFFLEFLTVFGFHKYWRSLDKFFNGYPWQTDRYLRFDQGNAPACTGMVCLEPKRKPRYPRKAGYHPNDRQYPSGGQRHQPGIDGKFHPGVGCEIPKIHRTPDHGSGPSGGVFFDRSGPGHRAGSKTAMPCHAIPPVHGFAVPSGGESPQMGHGCRRQSMGARSERSTQCNA